ncbi:MAG: transglycosylase SLT domain-containing protein [Pseudomonadota bacterium]
MARNTGLVTLLAAALLAGCATSPPRDPDNICSIFAEKRSWRKAARKSEQRWGTPTHVQMAIIYQESAFEHDAKPARKKLLGLVPWKRPSDAYGYAQALDSTWQAYKNDTGRRFADRDKFADAIDFVGWYTHQSQRAVGISKWDPYNQYLAYHEGAGGWKRGTYRKKRWLMDTAKRVDQRAREWGAQLKRCS